MAHEAAQALSFAGGLMLGLSSTLHCAAMCGGIAATVMGAFDPATGPGGRLRALAAAQSGRCLAYVAAGGFLGEVGSRFYGAMDHGAGHMMLRAVAAMSLGWVGLSLLDLAPAPIVLERLLAPLAARLRPSPRAVSRADIGRAGLVPPFIAGLGWGLLPCGMVYAALFYAMLGGSGLAGMAIMAGFGLGTLPAVTASALGIGGLRDLGRKPRARIAVGIALLVIALASVAIPAARAGFLCR